MKPLVLATAVAVVVAACHGSASPNATSRSAWCEKVALTTDAKNDGTRFDNTAERVLAVKSEMQVEALGCGAYYVGVSADAIMSAVIKAQPLPDGPGFIQPEDPSHCIMVYLNSDAPKPVANPLYFDGVRVYFVDDDVKAKVAQADARASWCNDIPFSSDPGSDRTGFANSEDRVKRIMAAVERPIKACPGVSRVERMLSTRAAADLDPFGVTVKTATGPSHLSWVLHIYLNDAKAIPPTNPLFLDGVRTYFTGPRLSATDAGASADGG